MKIRELKKGDRVIATKTTDSYKVGDTGTMVEDDRDGIPLIQWDHLSKRTAVYHKNVNLLSKTIQSDYQIY